MTEQQQEIQDLQLDMQQLISIRPEVESRYHKNKAIGEAYSKLKKTAHWKTVVEGGFLTDFLNQNLKMLNSKPKHNLEDNIHLRNVYGVSSLKGFLDSIDLFVADAYSQVVKLDNDIASLDMQIKELMSAPAVTADEDII